MTELLYLYLLQVYNARKKFLKPGKEAALWIEIDWQFMTDESSGEEGELVKHPLPWRSRGILNFLFVSMLLSVTESWRCSW